jgi:hypothetical protein
MGQIGQVFKIYLKDTLIIDFTEVVLKSVIYRLSGSRVDLSCNVALEEPRSGVSGGEPLRCLVAKRTARRRDRYLDEHANHCCKGSARLRAEQRDRCRDSQFVKVAGA